MFCNVISAGFPQGFSCQGRSPPETCVRSQGISIFLVLISLNKYENSVGGLETRAYFLSLQHLSCHGVQYCVRSTVLEESLGGHVINNHCT